MKKIELLFSLSLSLSACRVIRISKRLSLLSTGLLEQKAQFANIDYNRGNVNNSVNDTLRPVARSYARVDSSSW